MSSFALRITNFLIKWRLPLLVLAIAIGTVAYWPARGLDFDRSIESVFAPDDPVLTVYRKLRRTFGGNELVMAVYDDPGLLDPDGSGMDRLRQTSNRLAKVPGVDFTLSLDQPLGNRIVELENEVARQAREVLEGYTHGTDGRTVAVICVLIPESKTRVPRDETIRQIRAVMDDLPDDLPQGMITGEPVMVADGFRYVEEDGQRLGWSTSILLSLVILVSFRSLRWVIIPLAVVQLAIVLTRASLVWSGVRMTMVSSMFTAIVTVIGIASVVHILVRFREGRALGMSPRDALAYTGTRLAAPVCWAVGTDAVAFLALGLSRVGPIRDFGLMMAIGAMMVAVSIALVVPGLVLLGRMDTDPKSAWGEKRLDGQLARSADWIQRRPVAIAIVTVLVVGLSFIGVFLSEVETDFTKNFRAKTPIVQAYQYVETHLGGAGVWDIVLPAPEHPDWPFFTRVRRLESRLRSEVNVARPDGEDEPGLTKVLTLADIVVAGSPINLDGRWKEKLKNAAVYKGIEKLKEQMPGLVQQLYGEDRAEPGRHYMRIMLRAKERQPAMNKRVIIEQVNKIVGQEFPGEVDSPGGEVGGFFVLLTQLVDSILRDQWRTFGAATAGIGLMMILAFRSPLLAAITLLPNALPILAVTGLLGWTGMVFSDVKINMGTAMIAAVSIGLSIDSSIHYITAFQYARREGKSVGEAIATVQQSVGRAVVFSTLALVVGFAVLCTSQFVPMVYFGVLVSLTMLGALAGNLVVLPLLLRLILREKRDNPGPWHLKTTKSRSNRPAGVDR
jgi:predicted RND superfamily exporter protein